MKKIIFTITIVILLLFGFKLYMNSDNGTLVCNVKETDNKIILTVDYKNSFMKGYRYTIAQINQVCTVKIELLPNIGNDFPQEFSIGKNDYNEIKEIRVTCGKEKQIIKIK